MHNFSVEVRAVWACTRLPNRRKVAVSLTLQRYEKKSRYARGLFAEYEGRISQHETPRHLSFL